MASKGQTKRKDKDRIVLKTGESQRKNGSYQYRWTDRNGKRFTYTGTELMARCLCHEYDHLDGILYVDKAYEMGDDEE